MFKQTSIFNVKSALANNQNLVAGHAGGGEALLPSDDELSDSEGWHYLRSFWSGGTGAQVCTGSCSFTSLPHLSAGRLRHSFDNVKTVRIGTDLRNHVRCDRLKLSSHQQLCRTQ